jgi:hypothetical protein
MEINFANRTDLKTYFKKNSIPSESQFAAFIDASINQKDDGIIKLPGDPLSVEGSGEKGSVQNLLNFYSRLSDPEPSWSFVLNDQNADGSLVTGLNFVSQKKSRFFIQDTTGRVGIGTANPEAALDLVTGEETNGFQIKRAGQQQPFFKIGHNSGAGYLQLFNENGEAQVQLARDGVFQLRNISMDGNAGNMFIPGNVHFGTYRRQMINLWDASYGIGIQDSTCYFRSHNNFAWYLGGAHNDNQLNPGGGLMAMTVVASPEGGANAAITGDLTLGGNQINQRFILHSRANGKGDYFHFSCDDEKGNWNWNKGFIFKRDGNFEMKGIVTTQGVIFEFDRKDHIVRDGALYRYGGQCYLSVDDHLYLRSTYTGHIIHFNVSAGAINGVVVPAISDIRLKKDVTSFKEGLSIIRKINPIQYKYNGKAGTNDKRTNIGVIAQELKEIMPDMVHTFKAPLEEADTEQTELYAVDGVSFTYILINAVKELEEKINRLSVK